MASFNSKEIDGSSRKSLPPFSIPNKHQTVKNMFLGFAKKNFKDEKVEEEIKTQEKITIENNERKLQMQQQLTSINEFINNKDNHPPPKPEVKNVRNVLKGFVKKNFGEEEESEEEDEQMLEQMKARNQIYGDSTGVKNVDSQKNPDVQNVEQSPKQEVVKQVDSETDKDTDISEFMKDARKNSLTLKEKAEKAQIVSSRNVSVEKNMHKSAIENDPPQLPPNFEESPIAKCVIQPASHDFLQPQFLKKESTTSILKKESITTNEPMSPIEDIYTPVNIKNSTKLPKHDDSISNCSQPVEHRLDEKNQANSNRKVSIDEEDLANVNPCDNNCANGLSDESLENRHEQSLNMEDFNQTPLFKESPSSTNQPKNNDEHITSNPNILIRQKELPFTSEISTEKPNTSIVQKEQPLTSDISAEKQKQKIQEFEKLLQEESEEESKSDEEESIQQQDCIKLQISVPLSNLKREQMRQNTEIELSEVREEENDSLLEDSPSKKKSHNTVTINIEDENYTKDDYEQSRHNINSNKSSRSNRQAERDKEPKPSKFRATTTSDCEGVRVQISIQKNKRPNKVPQMTVPKDNPENKRPNVLPQMTNPKDSSENKRPNMLPQMTIPKDDSDNKTNTTNDKLKDSGPVVKGTIAKGGGLTNNFRNRDRRPQLNIQIQDRSGDRKKLIMKNFEGEGSEQEIEQSDRIKVRKNFNIRTIAPIQSVENLRNSSSTFDGGSGQTLQKARSSIEIPGVPQGQVNNNNQPEKKKFSFMNNSNGGNKGLLKDSRTLDHTHISVGSNEEAQPELGVEGNNRGKINWKKAREGLVGGGARGQIRLQR